MVAMGYILLALYATNTVFVGLPCNPTAPASMMVNVGPGAVITNSVIEATAFGSLAADTADPLIKMGINIGSTSFTLTAPTTSGQSQNYLIQGSFTEGDDSPATLTYFNSLNPLQSFSGPGNSGTPQNTRRSQRVSLQLKEGSPGSTGSQVTPPVDSGWFGLYVITVNFGQTAVTSSDISVFSGAPFLSAFLQSHHKGTPGNAPKIDLTSEVAGILPLANLPSSVQTTLPAVRQLLTGNVTLNVNASSGNDVSATGTTTWPFKTLQAAMDYAAAKYDFAGQYSLYLQMAHGTYSGFNAKNLAGGGSIYLQGDNASPSSVVISATNGQAISVGNAYVRIGGFEITTTGTPGDYNGTGDGITVGSGGNVVQNGPIVLGPCGGSQVVASGGGGYATLGYAVTVVGSAQAAFQAFEGGQITTVNSTLIVQNNPNFSSAFVVASTNANINAYNMVISGTATGLRYGASTNGVILTNGAGPNYFPGSAAGATGDGGQYV